MKNKLIAGGVGKLTKGLVLGMGLAVVVVAVCAMVVPQRSAHAAVCSVLGGAGTASGTAPARIDLSWTATDGAAGYNVFISTTSGGPYTLLGTTTNTSYSDRTGLTNGSTYYFVLQPVDGSGTVICQSNEAAITVPKGRGH